jgi:hypothetical protein
LFALEDVREQREQEHGESRDADECQGYEDPASSPLSG